ncbi:DgyrCDS13616 [Dimorphilus gyrociliatus]|uniref:DgyrCDS13616 n=1 Tax=Dimorphilus gyrociliatus TaxID=2664684 RepID=A0A7I8WB70_9ANNE|nr:DgyrCDS13616 [Dimorphilus gyrociliatus]
MMCESLQEESGLYPVRLTKNKRWETRLKNCTIMQFEPPSNLITGVGKQETVFVANGQIPGPTIIVYEDQQIVVKVRNQLIDSAVTIHWHGIYQRGTPFMDGSSRISHCPILPQQQFSYRFIASPKGTHFWHVDSPSLKITYQAFLKHN